MRRLHCLAAAVFFVSLTYVFLSRYISPESKWARWQMRPQAKWTNPTAARQFVTFPVKIDNKQMDFVYELYQPIEGGNLASVIKIGCHKPSINPDGISKVHLITGFVDLTLPSYRKTLGDLNWISNKPDNETLQARHMEIIDVLQVNLLHDMIEAVHVLVFSLNTAVYLKSLNLQNSERLIIRVMDKDVGLKEQVEYGLECLEGKVVAITNQDNTIGRGWENKEYVRILKEKNVMYGLTRHSTATEDVRQGSNCTWTHMAQNNCDLGGIYWGSHDTFIFQVRMGIKSHLEELSGVTPDKAGMENLFLWFFNARMNYTVLNPCQVLFVHHHHCIPIRGLNRPRINSGGRSLTVGFSDRLE